MLSLSDCMVDCLGHSLVDHKCMLGRCPHSSSRWCAVQGSDASHSMQVLIVLTVFDSSCRLLTVAILSVLGHFASVPLEPVISMHAMMGCTALDFDWPAWLGIMDCISTCARQANFTGQNGTSYNSSKKAVKWVKNANHTIAKAVVCAQLTCKPSQADHKAWGGCKTSLITP